MSPYTFKKSIFSIATLSLSLGLCAANSASANSDILFVLDGSGSMWGQIGGVAKIETAKKTLSKLLNDVPASSRLGLMTYGTTDKDSCSDVTYANPIGAGRSQIKQTISTLQPLGKTPIDLSIAMGITHLANTDPADVQKSLVLISDGIETCDGNPCVTASAAKAGGVNMKVHVVGFDVNAEARNQLECIAKNGGGQYFNAADTAGFQTAMQSVVQIAQAQPEQPAPPTPATPVKQVVYSDDFNGDTLGEEWGMNNADEESYIVEEGELLLVSSKVQRFNAGEPVNLLKLGNKMPSGNWDMNLYLKFDAQTGRDNFWFGLHKDAQNYMGIQFYSKDGSTCWGYGLGLERNSKGEATRFSKYVIANSACGWGKDKSHSKAKATLADDGFVLTLSKRGRNYMASITMNGVVGDVGTPRTVSTETLTSLRLPGQPALMIGKYENYDGETLSLIDRIEIVKVN